MLQISQNSITLYVTANSDTERQAWTQSFARLLGAATVYIANGLWEGIAEPCNVIQYIGFGADNFPAWCIRVLDEVRLYQLGANQQAVCITITLEGSAWNFILETAADYREAREFILDLAIPERKLK